MSQLRPKHYIEIICEAASLSESDAIDLFHHKYNMHIYRNPNFIDELEVWIKNVYDMYKAYLFTLKKSDSLKRNIDQMYSDQISMADMLDERFKPQNIGSIYYNKLVWGKINNAFSYFRQRVMIK